MDNPSSPSHSRQEIQSQLKLLVKGLHDKSSEEGCYRGMVRLALERKESPGAFGKHLRRAKLNASATSRIVRILRNNAVARRFAEEPNPISFRAALRLSRNPKLPPAADPSSGTGKNKKDPASALEALCLRLACFPHWQSAISLRTGIFALRFEPGVNGGAFALHRGNGPRAAIQCLPMELTPEIAQSLSRAARFSGLNRSKAARELLSQLPLATLMRDLDKIMPLPTRIPYTVATKMPKRRTLCDAALVRVDVDLHTGKLLTEIADRTGLMDRQIAAFLIGPDAFRRIERIVGVRLLALNRRRQDLTKLGARDPGKPGE